MNFVVFPTEEKRGVGFWLQADSAEEARRLVALNVPCMSSAINPDVVECRPDETYTPAYGAIVQGSVRTYTITRRSDHSNSALHPRFPADPGRQFARRGGDARWPNPVRA